MGSLFLTRTDDRVLAERGKAAARAQAGKAGLSQPTSHTFPGWSLLHFGAASGPKGLLEDGDDLVAVAGTLVFDGRIGGPALAALLRETRLPALDWSRIGGEFVAVVRQGGRSFLFGDFFAAFQLFHDREQRFFSTSLLAALQTLPRVRFDPQGVYEHAFNVVPIGDDTPFAELKTLGPKWVLELTPNGVIRHATAKPLPDAPAKRPLPDRIAEHAERLHAAVAPFVAAFGNRIQCPLSGGLDSRLLLAALRSAGSTPSIYVYGPEGSADVQIGRAIGAAEGFEVTWIDKQAAAIAPEAFPAQVEANFYRFDGMPTYGNIFDNGGHAAAQRLRHADGALAASGGCGEVYRNFFLLPDRSLTATTIARSFFARFTRKDATQGFDGRVFLDRIADKIADALELPDAHARMSRTRAEQAYPRVRCRALFGREISLEAQHGAYMMPFLDHRLVATALTLPMSAKHAGAFEAQLLAAIDPALARHPSAYGHDFAGPPNLRHRFGEWSSRIRPTWVRQHSYAVQRRLRPMGDEHGGLLSPDYMHRVVDPEFPAMRRYFDMAAITDAGLWRRIACLEYLAAWLGSRLEA
jgi:asparagine synthetase B (glutamine-hydrolysing)